jgi:multidrug efflux pump subunit AcrA (membrane-fusion protein)
MRRIYHAVAMLAIIHLLVLTGLIGILVGTGRLDRDKAQQIAAVLRGERPLEAKAVAATSRPVIEPVLARDSSEKIEQANTNEEVQRLLDLRRQRELSDRKNLVDAAMLSLTRQREAMAKQLADFEQAQRQAKIESEQAVPDREVAILSGLSAKSARDLLMKKQMPDAVRMFMLIKSRAATDIIESCKTDEQKTWAVQVLQEVSNKDKGRAEQMAKAVR